MHMLIFAHVACTLSMCLCAAQLARAQFLACTHTCVLVCTCERMAHGRTHGSCVYMQTHGLMGHHMHCVIIRGHGACLELELRLAW